MRYLLVLLLSGCGMLKPVSPEDLARNRRLVEENDARAKAAYDGRRFKSMEEQCSGYGFRPGTPDMANCIMQLDNAPQRGATVCQRLGNSIICN